MSQECSRPIFRKSLRVGLTPLEEADHLLCTRWINDPGIFPYLGIAEPMSSEEEKAFLRGHSDRKPYSYVFGIFVLEEEKLIGVMGLHNISYRDGIAFTGSFIGEREYRKNGYAHEAKMLLLDYAFNTLNLRKICSAAWGFNRDSIKHNTRCGFKPDGERVKQVYREGQYWNEVLLAVFKEDWLPLWEKFKKEQNIQKVTD